MQRLYANGTVLPLTGSARAEALVSEDGTIIAVGKRQELKERFPSAEEIDLEGGVLLPAFIDAHSHLSSTASSFLYASLEGTKSFSEIAERIKRFIKENNVPSGSWVIASGYDHNALKEQKPPTLALLDSCSEGHPLFLQHVSGHSGVCNSKALQALGIDEHTPSPDGGKIGKEGGKPNGYLEESACFSAMKRLPPTGAKELLSAYRKTLDLYASHGISMIQEGMAVKEMVPMYQALLASGMLDRDIVAYPTPSDADALFQAFPASVESYDRHLRFGGYKIVLDGSPQGRTAWMRTPYNEQEPPYYGYPSLKDEDVVSAVRTATAHHKQILAHCNGDAAAAQFLRAIEEVEKTEDVKALRPVMIHAQLLGIDQLEKVKQLGVTPSFFVAHVYHWGDVHIKNFGFDRARTISPTASAKKEGIRFTFHQDTPVIAPDMLETLWCATCRTTKEGVLLGADEGIDIVDALRAVTSDAAWQYGEEAKRGTLSVGKRADFVLLDGNPLTVETDALRTLKVKRTIIADKEVYRA